MQKEYNIEIRICVSKEAEDGREVNAVLLVDPALIEASRDVATLIQFKIDQIKIVIEKFIEENPDAT